MDKAEWEGERDGQGRVGGRNSYFYKRVKGEGVREGMQKEKERVRKGMQRACPHVSTEK